MYENKKIFLGRIIQNLVNLFESSESTYLESSELDTKDCLSCRYISTDTLLIFLQI